jgi:hypothetical protein
MIEEEGEGDTVEGADGVRYITQPTAPSDDDETPFGNIYQVVKVGMAERGEVVTGCGGERGEGDGGETGVVGRKKESEGGEPTVGLVGENSRRTDVRVRGAVGLAHGSLLGKSQSIPAFSTPSKATHRVPSSNSKAQILEKLETSLHTQDISLSLLFGFSASF